MEIDELTLGQLKQIQSMGGHGVSCNIHPYQIGEKYFIRTVTHYFTGQLDSVYEHELTINNAAWIADTGRFHEMLKSGDMKEVEPYPEGLVIIGRGAIIDASVIDFDLPRIEK